MTKKVKVRMKKYGLIRDAVEAACRYSSMRFSKHLEPTMTIDELNRDTLCDLFVQEVMNELCEIIDFEDGLDDKDV